MTMNIHNKYRIFAKYLFDLNSKKNSTYFLKKKNKQQQIDASILLVFKAPHTLTKCLN